MRTIIDTGTYGEYLHYGMPLALVTVVGIDGNVNVSTNTSIAPLPGDRQRVALGVLKENYTDELLNQNGEFVINIIPPELRSAAQQCGTLSGRRVDKLEVCNLSTLPARFVKPPLIKECPLNIECRVVGIHDLGELNLWIADILAVEVADLWSNGRGGVDLETFDPLFYTFGYTMTRGPLVGAGGL